MAKNDRIMFLYICVVKFNVLGVVMYSPELMKYLINYQKNDFKPEEPKSKEIHFDSKRAVVWQKFF